MAPKVADIAVPIRKSVYQPGEWVWCEWNKIYYKAKILERGIENGGQYYNIHYWKFSKLWDMTVSESKIFPVMAENNKWVLNHNKLMRKEIKEAKKAREGILSLLMKGKSPKETPPYLILENLNVTKYLNEGNNEIENSNYKDVEINHSNGTASTSGGDEITNKHSELINIDDNDHVNGSLLNTKISTGVSMNNHNDTEMNIKCENTVDPEVDISADAGDLNVNEEIICSFHQAGSNIDVTISKAIKKTNDSSKLDKWLEDVQVTHELQIDDNSSKLKLCNNTVSPQYELGFKSIENEQIDRIENDFNSASNAKVIHHIEIENSVYSSQNGSTQILKRKEKDHKIAEREKKKRRKKKHMIINNHMDLTGRDCHVMKSNKLCMDLMNNKKNEISIDGNDLAEKSKFQIPKGTFTFQKKNYEEDLDDHVQNENIGTQFGNMIGSEGDSFANSKGNDLSNKEGATLQILNTTLITDSNNENKMINIDNSTPTEGIKIPKLKKKKKNRRKLSDVNICMNNDDPVSYYHQRGDIKIEGDLNIEEASTSSVTGTEAIYENEMIKIVIASTEGGNLNIEEVKTLSGTVNKANDENLINIPCKSTEVDKISFNHCASNENWSCGSSSTSLPLYNIKVETDDDNDGQNLDDDNQYVCKEKVKLDDYDHNIYDQFSFEKPYSRAAKRKATEAISSLMSKPIGKEKKTDGKKSKTSKKKDDDEPSNVITQRDLNLNCYFLQIFIQDYHLLTDDRYMPVVPSKITVYDILSDYTKYASADLRVFSQLIKVFHYVFESLILHPIERPKHTEIVQKYPSVYMAHMYGLPHLVRFIYYLPTVLGTLQYANQFSTRAIHFIRGLTDYLEEQRMELTMDLYENTLPEYVRCSFLQYR